jgi:DNA polymerase
MLMAADYSNIEGRGIAWLAGEKWKLQAFRDFDGGNGSDLYILAFARAFGLDPADVDDAQRQIGKVMELALGYAGGVGAFLSMGANYNVDLATLARITKDATDPDEWQAGCDAYDRIEYDPDSDAADDDKAEEDEDYALLEPFKGDPRRGLPREHWVAIRCIVRAWRKAHPAIVSWWRQLERAAIDAVSAKGSIQTVGNVTFMASRSALRCRLPSGRHLTYPFARVIRRPSPKTGKTETALIYSAAKGQSKAWRPTRAYGGLLAENITQAVARDVLADALINLERRGFATVLHVHDEIVAECPADRVDAVAFRSVCEQLPAWATGLPLVTGAPWAGERYRK